MSPATNRPAAFTDSSDTGPAGSGPVAGGRGDGVAGDPRVGSAVGAAITVGADGAGSGHVVVRTVAAMTSAPAATAAATGCAPTVRTT